MKGPIIEPSTFDENVIVQVTKKVLVDKHLQIKVPTGFQAMVFIDEKLSFRIDPTMGEFVYKRDKDFLKKFCKVAFVRKKLLPNMRWGCGNVPVNNERIKEAYQVGAHGDYSVEIKEISKLLNCFEETELFTIDDIRGKTIDTVKSVGIAVLGKFFANTNISVFEISAHIDEIRKKMYESLVKEVAFLEMGVKLKDLTVASIYVPQDDMAIIKSRINASGFIVEDSDE